MRHGVCATPNINQPSGVGTAGGHCTDSKRLSVPEVSLLERQIKRGLRPLWTCSQSLHRERIRPKCFLRNPRPII
ncbi:jg3884 [Pararge aegeria aegeria]|uniref:Jg3884 protein n=1 Tax=Pararge aegeria aegeria TaxID=348720 RepID=A0A8S4R525_9NEOP|nr:jg3884 [Pararge aegeria aegeria]